MPIQIKTERLTLRPWKRKDRSALNQMCRDPEMMQYVTGGSAMSNGQIRDFLKRQKRHLRNHQVCFFAMEHTETKQIVGLAGMQPLDPVDENTPGDFELGWWVWKEHWRNGYATEAGLALLDYARGPLSLKKVAAVITPANSASIGVAEKLGMTLECQKPANQTINTRPDWMIAYYSRGL